MSFTDVLSSKFAILRYSATPKTRRYISDVNKITRYKAKGCTAKHLGFKAKAENFAPQKAALCTTIVKCQC